MGPAMKKDPLAFFPSSSPPSKTPPPPPHRRPHLPLPPPPPLHLRSSLPPLPPPPWGTHSLLIPPGQGTPIPPPAAIPASAAIPSRPEASRSMRGGGDHLVVRTRDCDLAGVPPELLPPKKRVVRHHPYAAAWAIQEMASRGGVEKEESEEDGLRAELLRLRISRPAQVLTKPLTLSDRSRDMARLVLPERLVRASPLLGMLTDAERRLVLGPGGLPVPAFDRLGRAYRMTLRRDPSARTYLLRGQWTLFVSRHDMRGGDAVQLLAFRPSAWQARLHKHGEGGLGMAMLHCPKSNAHPCCWTNRERDAADALLLLVAPRPMTPSPSSCRLTTATATVSSQLGVR